MLKFGYHGSSKIFEKFNTKEIFLAKGEHEARRYGSNMYKVWFEGNPMFETGTIFVIGLDNIKEIENITSS